MVQAATSPPVAGPAPHARPPGDVFMRRLLCIPATRRPAGEDEAHRLFSIGIVLSGLRCLISYIVLPVVTPLVGAATSVGPYVGIPISVVALFFDVKGMRRFWLADHRWRWAMTGVYGIVMGLVFGLLVADIVTLAG
ncbi:MAG: hypothetical protein ACRDYC_02245 [Acidimicrobiales bacterium]